MASVRDAGDQVRTIHDVEVEEAQGADSLVEPAVRDLLRVAKKEQVLLDLGKPEAIGREVEVSGEASDEVQVSLFGTRGHVANAQGLAHPLAQGGGDHDRSPFNEIRSVDSMRGSRAQPQAWFRPEASRTRSAPRSGFVQLNSFPHPDRRSSHGLRSPAPLVTRHD